MEEVKIDKRTREYKDSQMQPPGVLATPTINIVDTERAVEQVSEPPTPTPEDIVAAKKLLESVGVTVTPPGDVAQGCPDSVDYSNPKNNPGWSKCFKCGADLDPNEDGSRRFYKSPTPCHTCVWANYKKKNSMSVNEKISLDEMDVEERNKYFRKRNENGRA